MGTSTLVDGGLACQKRTSGQVQAGNLAQKILAVSFPMILVLGPEVLAGIM